LIIHLTKRLYPSNNIPHICNYVSRGENILKEIITKNYTNKDFPFYKNNPRISKKGWIILFISIFIGFIVSDLFYGFSQIIGSFLMLIVMIIPLLYYSKWDYSILMEKPNKDEIKLAILMFIFYLVYAAVMSFILGSLNLIGPDGGPADLVMTWDLYASLIFAMMSEELIKFIPLMFFMKLFYKYSENKKVSFILSSLIVLVGFGILHFSDSVTIYSVLLLQGLGSIFELYGYFKTKNLFVPYLSHLLTDGFLMGLMFLPH